MPTMTPKTDRYVYRTSKGPKTKLRRVAENKRSGDRGTRLTMSDKPSRISRQAIRAR